MRAAFSADVAISILNERVAGHERQRAHLQPGEVRSTVQVRAVLAPRVFRRVSFSTPSASPWMLACLSPRPLLHRGCSLSHVRSPSASFEPPRVRRNRFPHAFKEDTTRGQENESYVDLRRRAPGALNARSRKTDSGRVITNQDIVACVPVVGLRVIGAWVPFMSLVTCFAAVDSNHPPSHKRTTH